MGDLALEFVADQLDIDVTGGTARIDNGIVTAIYTTLGIDAAPDGTPGWWGAVGDDRLLGNRAFTITKNSVAGREALRQAVTIALGWLTQEGVASSIMVYVLGNTGNRVNLQIQIAQPGRGTAPGLVNLYWDFTQQGFGVEGSYGG